MASLTACVVTQSVAVMTYHDMVTFADFLHGIYQYYLDRPELSEYTVKTELKRMSYSVTPPSGGPGARTSNIPLSSIQER